MIGAVKEFLRIVRYTQASVAVQHYHADIERSRAGLEKAIRARDLALGEIRVHDPLPQVMPGVAIVHLAESGLPAFVNTDKRGRSLALEGVEAGLRG